MTLKTTFILGMLAGILGTSAVVAVGVSTGVTDQRHVPASTPASELVVPGSTQSQPFNPVEPVVPRAETEPALSNEATLTTEDVSDLTLQLRSIVERLSAAEARIDQLENAGSIDTTQSSITEPDPLEQRSRLLDAGFTPYTVDEIESIRNQMQLQRLDLRDRATREGWIDTEQFREAMRELVPGIQLRQSLGDDDYDRLLIAQGRNNRVQIDSVIGQSAAAQAGLETGDVLYSYAGERIFTVRDLQSQTTAGQRDESVPVQVIRQGDVVDLYISRGPMGVTISGTVDAVSQ